MENVMLNASQTQIKIVDFGLSNVWSSDHPLRTHCGSPEYAAPELFVAGKEYGPEVDLWSLGIIFYGMVVGQLPFVGGRKNQLSSQERRKRLVAQINKGLGATQRQAIAPLSLEFRTMLNKLLTADTTKRISIKELLLHPWITEKGRKVIQKHPFKDADDVVKTKIIRQLSEVFQVNEESVIAEMAKNPYGRLSGMYNILSYKHFSDQFNTNRIALNISQNKSSNNSPAKTHLKPKSAALVKSQQTLYNQYIVLLNKVSKQQIDKRVKSANQAIVLSKNVAKLSRSKLEQIQNKFKTTKSNYSKTNSVVINRKIQENQNQKCATKTLSKSKMFESKAATINSKRPYTTGTTTRSIPKPNKRSCTSALPPQTVSANRELQRQQICTTAEGMGDILVPKKSSNVHMKNLKHKNHLANEPIARSIAGYLVKNVPEYMFTRIRK